MRLLPVIAASAAILLATPPARAGGVEAQATLSRHHTTNALDSTVALADRYSVLRGSIAHTLPHGLGSTRIAADFDLRRYDTYDIEDDAAAGVSVTTTLRPSETLELRGTLSATLSSEGDELMVGDAIVGMHTSKAIVAAGLQAGLKLSPDTVLVLEGAASRDRSGDTRFQDDVFLPQRLEPRRDAVRLAGTLTRTQGMFGYGMSGAAGLRRAEPIGFLPRLTMLDHALKLRGNLTFANGAKIAAEAGIETLELLDTSFRQARAAYELAAETPLFAGLSLRGMLKSGYDLATTDDPIAVRARRIEAEAAWQSTAALRFGAGVFVERRENVGLGTRERLRGLYAEAAWQAHERLSVLLRIDATRRMLEGLGLERRALDIQLALSTRL